MARTRTINIGDTFTATSGARLVWRVDRRLNDGIHVVLVCDGAPSQRKTVSISALNDRDQFTPVALQAA